MYATCFMDKKYCIYLYLLCGTTQSRLGAFGWLFFEYGLYLCQCCQLFLSKVIVRALLEDAVQIVIFHLLHCGSKLGTEIVRKLYCKTVTTCSSDFGEK